VWDILADFENWPSWNAERIRRGEVALTGAVGEFAKRHGIEPAPSKAEAKAQPKVQAKPRARKPRTPKVQAGAVA
jgi:hypothetical protein